MNLENLNMNLRVKKANHDAKRTRKHGKVPGVIYGKDIKNLLFEIGELELNSAIIKQGEHGTLNVNIDGENINALIKEVQRDVVTKKIIHIDLEKVDENKVITSKVPVHFVGEELATKNGRILQKDRDSINVQCTPENLPKFVDLNVSNANVGSVYKISDIEVGEEISILDNLDSVIASIGYEQKIPENIDEENK